MVHPDVRLDAVASVQHGAFSLFQASKAGLTYSQIRHRVSSGRWVELSSAVYGMASSPDTFERSLIAAILAHPRAVAAGESAARLHGFYGYDNGRVEIMIPLTGNARTRDTYVVRSTFFNTVHRVTVRNIVSTSPAETALTLAGRISKPRLERLLDDLFGTSSATFEEFVDIVDRCRGGRVRGIRNLRSLLADRSPDAEGESQSTLESALYRLLNEPGMPSFLPQYEIDIGPRRVRVDAYVPAWRLVVEADGRRWHTSRSDFQRDRQRDNLLQSRGYRVCRLTFQDLILDPDGCRRTILTFTPD